MKTTVANLFGEKLDVLIEGNEKSDKILVFVHEFGMDKNDSFNLFSEISSFLKDDFLIVRFDLSGYGKSEGKDTEFQFQKAAGDIDSILKYIKRVFPKKEIHLFAHAFGSFAVALLSPVGIKKILFTSIPNADTAFLTNALQERILAKGGKVDENGFSHYPRTSGALQMIGRDFWRTLRGFKPCEYIEELGNKTQLLVIRSMQNEVLVDKHFEEYKEIGSIKYVEVEGDHNFTSKKDRRDLFDRIKGFLLGE